MKKTLKFFGFACAILAIIAVFVLFSPAATISGLSTKLSFSGYELIFGVSKELIVVNASAGLITAFVFLCLGICVAIFISLSELFFPNISPKFPIFAIIGAAILITSGILFFCAPNLISFKYIEYSQFTQEQAFNFVGIISTFSGALLGLRAVFQIIK